MRKTCAMVAVLAASWLMLSLATPAAARRVRKCKEISFKQDVLPALQESCLACHYAKEQWPGLDLSTEGAYADVVNRASSEISSEKLVEPSDPEHSFLVQKILKATPQAGGQMPP